MLLPCASKNHFFFVLHSLKDRLPSNTQVLYRLVQPDNEHREGGLIGFTLGTVTVADSKLLLTILFSAARTHRANQQTFIQATLLTSPVL